jgi:cytochrome c biogenesis protein CcmG/thiol:disulfide interchange protein DsbE
MPDSQPRARVETSPPLLRSETDTSRADTERAKSETSAGPCGGRAGLARNIFTAIALAIAISAMVWFFARPSGPPASQSVTLTAGASGPAPRVGKEAPDFSGVDLDGNPLELSQLRGHPVWLAFGATWCPPCRAEAPDLEAAYEQYKDSGLIIVAVDVGEDADTIRNYVARTGLTYPFAADSATEIAAQYRVTGLPTHFFVDANGLLRDMRIGSVGKKTIDEKIATILPP